MKQASIEYRDASTAPGRRSAVALAVAVALTAAGCASTGPAPDGGVGIPIPSAARPGVPSGPDATAAASPGSSARPPARGTARRGGAFYLDDGPGDAPPPNLASIPDAEPRSEPLHRFANRPYVVFGRGYTPMTERAPYRARGVATWYGKRYHAQKTSSGEVYDMYQMTGAHPTLPIPSYVRVTNIANGRQVIIRINDRGPFIGERLIDLSYAAAFRLGYVEAGSANVEVEKLIPGVNWPLDARTVAARKPAAAATAAVAGMPTPGATTAALPPAPPLVEAVLPEPPPPATVAAAAGTPASASELPGRPGALPLAAESGGVFLQLGAFGDRNNAETFLGRIRPELGEVARLAHVHQARGLHRVHLGPYANEREARAAVDGLMRRLNIRPVLAVR